MNNSINVISKIYKPYRLTKINNCLLMHTMEGDYVVKKNPKINYPELYKYLNSRCFNYVPKIIDASRENATVFEYQEDLSNNKDQKALDLIKLIALLHSKTIYFKEITNDKYKEIYDILKNNIVYINNYYSNLFDIYITEELNSPSHYLFLRNYSLIHNACNYCLTKIDEWNKLIENKTHERVCLIHNNLQLDHYLKNTNEYLISWDNYTYDNPVLDLFKFYQNEWPNLSFKDLFKTYNDNNELLEEEKILLDILISIPFKIEETEKEIDNVHEYRRLINYLNKSSKIVLTN